MLLPLRDFLPHARIPVVTIALIALNLLVFLLGFGRAQLQNTNASVSNHDVWVYEYGAIPCEVFARCDNQPGVVPVEHNNPAGMLWNRVQETATISVPERSSWITVLSSMFLHGGVIHLVFNMLFLWVFGGNVEDAMSRPAFVGFFLTGGIIATLAQSLVHPSSTIPQIGASGGIAAVIGAYLVLYPRSRIYTMVLFPIFVVLPAWVVAGGWGVLQFIATWQSVFVPGASTNGIAYMAHLAGFGFGLAVIKWIAEPNPIYHRLYDDR